MSEFNDLVAELDMLSKSMPVQDDANIQEAAATDAKGKKTKAKSMPGDGTMGDDGSDDGTGGNANNDDDDDMGKSLTLTMADGSIVEAIDGTALVKALQAENVALAGQVADLSKALTSTVGLVKQLHGSAHTQNDMIKSLASDMAKFGGQGTGRRAMLSVHEKPSGQPQAPAVPNKADLLRKAMTALKDGKIAASDVARVDAYLGRGLDLPADLAKALA